MRVLIFHELKDDNLNYVISRTLLEESLNNIDFLVDIDALKSSKEEYETTLLAQNWDIDSQANDEYKEAFAYYLEKQWEDKTLHSTFDAFRAVNPQAYIVKDNIVFDTFDQKVVLPRTPKTIMHSYIQECLMWNNEIKEVLKMNSNMYVTTAYLQYKRS